MAQIIVALCVSVLVSILLTPVLIKKFRQRDIRQEIREDGPQTHLVKAGTPTMGGLAILAGIWGGVLFRRPSGCLNRWGRASCIWTPCPHADDVPWTSRFRR